MKFHSQNQFKLFCKSKVVITLCAAILINLGWCRSQEENPTTHKLFQIAREADHHGNYAGAEKLYRLVLSIDPDLLAARVNLGIDCYHQDKDREAIFEFQQVLHIHPREFNSLLFSGLAYTNLGQYKHARELLREAARINGSDGLVFFALGNLAMDQGDVNAAVPLLKRALTLDPNNVRVMWTLGQAYALLAYRDDVKPTVAADYPALVKDMLRAVEERQPNSALLHVFKGDIFVARKLPAAAILEYRRALKTDPQWPDIHLLIGSLLATQGRWKEAIREINLQIRTHPEDLRAKVKLAVVYSQIGNYRAAVTVLQQVLRHDPHNYDADYQLAQAYLNLNQAALAVRLLRRATNLEPRESPPFYLLYRAYRALKQPEKAAAALKQFEELKTAGSRGPEAPASNFL